MTFIALLRAINLGAHNRISMTALREMLADMGMRDVRTLVQSGNVVFEARTRSTAALEKDLERATAARLDVTTDYVVRTPDEWRSVVARNPFVKEAVAKPNLAFVMALKRAPDRKAVAALEAWVAGPERLRVDARHVYLVYPGGIGRSRLTGALIEKRLGVRGTARNWNTVLKLAEMTA
jgi:uncharacterized protein (DUF1697 family)